MAIEVLIRTHDSWMDSIDKNSWDTELSLKYARRRRKGSPIAILPVGMNFGSKHVPPKYIVITVIGATLKDGAEYIQPSYFETITVVSGREKRLLRKYQFDVGQIDKILAQSAINKGRITMEKVEFENFLKDVS